MDNKQHFITTGRMGATLFTQQLPELPDDNIYSITVRRAMQTWVSNASLGSCFLFMYLVEVLNFYRLVIIRAT